jgi:hypothetical protein
MRRNGRFVSTDCISIVDNQSRDHSIIDGGCQLNAGGRLYLPPLPPIDGWTQEIRQIDTLGYVTEYTFDGGYQGEEPEWISPAQPVKAEPEHDTMAQAMAVSKHLPLILIPKR